MTWRYAAYALALELKCPDVDAMLATMSAMQFHEWLAFFRIREEERSADKGSSPAEQQNGHAGLQARLLGAFKGYSERRKQKPG